MLVTDVEWLLKNRRIAAGQNIILISCCITRLQAGSVFDSRQKHNIVRFPSFQTDSPASYPRDTGIFVVGGKAAET
jgi:hypothetical protein